MKTDPRQVKRIVILRTDRIGEVLLSTPVIEALRRKFPSAGISFVTSAYASDIVSDREDLTEVIDFDTISVNPCLCKTLALAAKLRKRHFDMAIILNPHKLLHLSSFLAGIKCRVGYNRKWPFLLTHKVEDKKREGLMHEVEYNLELLKIIDVYEKNTRPFIPVLSKSVLSVDKLFQERGITGTKRIVAIHPGSSNSDKRWPPEKFREVAKMLAESASVEVVLIGDDSEKPLCEEIGSGLRGVYNLAGSFTVKELAAFLKRVDLLITNDNGPMHIAAALGTKVVAIFNSDLKGSNPKRWGPYGEGHIVIYRPLDEIMAEEVVEAAEKIFK
ncbi:MAG: glycosyltransferase family 9 protein [Candidatus Omnitrophica bacterium]|nr:glycosyltransferase family 9 protein [Candidatus Omnitrophota bacterium]